MRKRSLFALANINLNKVHYYSNYDGKFGNLRVDYWFILRCEVCTIHLFPDQGAGQGAAQAGAGLDGESAAHARCHALAHARPAAAPGGGRVIRIPSG